MLRLNSQYARNNEQYSPSYTRKEQPKPEYQPQAKTTSYNSNSPKLDLKPHYQDKETTFKRDQNYSYASKYEMPEKEKYVQRNYEVPERRPYDVVQRAYDTVAPRSYEGNRQKTYQSLGQRPLEDKKHKPCQSSQQNKTYESSQHNRLSQQNRAYQPCHQRPLETDSSNRSFHRNNPKSQFFNPTEKPRDSVCDFGREYPKNEKKWKDESGRRPMGQEYSKNEDKWKDESGRRPMGQEYSKNEDKWKDEIGRRPMGQEYGGDEPYTRTYKKETIVEMSSKAVGRHETRHDVGLKYEATHLRRNEHVMRRLQEHERRPTEESSYVRCAYEKDRQAGPTNRPKSSALNMCTPEKTIVHERDFEPGSSERKKSLVEKSEMLRQKLNKLTGNQNNTPVHTINNEETHYSQQIYPDKRDQLRDRMRTVVARNEKNESTKMEYRDESDPLNKISLLNDKINERIQSIISNFGKSK